MNVLQALQDQRAELIRKRESLRAAASALDTDIADLDIAVRVVEKAVGQPIAVHQEAQPPGDDGARPTYRTIITKVLKAAYPRGLTVHGVLEGAMRDHGVELSQNTTSVMLGRIKNSGQATLNGRHWFYVSSNVETANQPVRVSPPSSQPFSYGRQTMPP